MRIGTQDLVEERALVAVVQRQYEEEMKKMRKVAVVSKLVEEVSGPVVVEIGLGVAENV